MGLKTVCVNSLERPEAAGSVMPRLLLISFFFPPHAGMRSRRMAAFVESLVKAGYDVDVVTVAHGSGLPKIDREMLEGLDEKVNVVRAPAGFSYRLLDRVGRSGQGPHRSGGLNQLRNRLVRGAKAAYLRLVGPLLVPDRLIEWFPAARTVVRRLLETRSYDVILSSSFPYTSHLLGAAAKRRSGALWVADYGDPWVFNPRFPRWRYAIDHAVEARLLEQMDAVCVTTQATKEGFLDHYPFLDEDRIWVIPNGYDPLKYRTVEPERRAGFCLMYTGAFYDRIREPYALFEALSRVRAEGVSAVFAGYMQPHFLDWVRARGIQNIEFLGHQSHDRAVALQKGADALLLVVSTSTGYQTPGKTYEYMAAGRPILAVAEEDHHPVAQFLRSLRRALVVRNDVGDIVQGILDLKAVSDAGRIQEEFDLDEESALPYAWNRLGEQLARRTGELLLREGRPRR